MNRTTRSLAAVACTALMATTFAACGSSGSEALTKSEWIKKADKICKDTTTELNKIGDKLSSAKTAEDANKILGEGADKTLDEVKAIKKLTPPKSISKDVDAMLAAVTEGANKIKTDGVALLQSGQNPLADASTKAKALGLKECGSN
ncbi:MAG: hypothetical protein ACJ72D_05225 [Marmoricola sp.]